MDVSGFRERPHHLVDILWLAPRFDGKRIIRHTISGSVVLMGQDMALRSHGHPSCASGVDFIAHGDGTVVFRFCRYQR